VEKMRTVEWDYQKNLLRLIDQRRLPVEFVIQEYADYLQVGQAIRSMVVRGAPAIGATAAFGLTLAAFQSPAVNRTGLEKDITFAAGELEKTRPTAVNLAWALKRMLGFMVGHPEYTVTELPGKLLFEAQKIADEDVEINLSMARYGAELIQTGDTIIHHCNTGSLATVDWGTALGVIRMAFDQGKRIHVLVDETRPRLQGARLTAWELKQYGIPYDIISDNAAGYFLRSGKVQKVFFGGDRMAANGDVANKIGTYMLALAASDNGIPAYSVVPTSTIDISLPHGGLIPIEEREMTEVLDIQIAGERVSPEGATARNPAFDVTPHRLLAGIVTEKGVIFPPFERGIRRMMAA
jgi:methylthioribose-1-phosphate isomerase